MSKPVDDDVLDWASGGGNVSKPGSGAIAMGWQVGQIAVSSHQNWIDRDQNNWLRWIKEVLEGTEGDFRLIHARTTANESPFRISQGPEAHAAGNAWRPLISGNAGGNRNLRLFSGKLSQGVGALWTLNSNWNATTQLWELEESSQDAIAIGLDASGRVRVWSKPAGSPAWGPTAWGLGQATLGDLAVEQFTATSIDISSNSELHGAVHAYGDLDVDGSVDVGASLQVSGVLNKNLPVNLAAAILANVNATAGYRDAAGILEASTSVAVFEIDLSPFVPPGAEITQARLIANPGSSTSGATLSLHKRLADFTAGTFSTQDLRSGGGVSTSGPGSQVVIYNANQNNILGANDVAIMRVVLDGHASAPATAARARISWSHTGTRSY